MDNAQIIRNAVREKAQIITGLNRAVWEYAELGYQETKSAAAIIKALEDDGFTVTKDLAGIPTAFKAVWGSGSPVVGILGEYDALPGLSQKAGVAAPEPDEEYILTLCGDTVIFSSGLLAEALSRLDEREREMIYLSFFKRIPQHEIGRQYGRSRSTAGYHIRKALRQLQAEMEGMAYEK